MTDKASMRGGPVLKNAEPDESGIETVDVPAESEETDSVEHNADGSITIHLAHAFLLPPLKGKDIAEGVDKIVLREMTAGDMVDMDQAESDTGKVVTLASSLSGVPVSVLKRLHYEDFAVVHAVVNDKLGKFLRTSVRVSSRLFGG